MPWYHICNPKKLMNSMVPYMCICTHVNGASDLEQGLDLWYLIQHRLTSPTTLTSRHDFFLEKTNFMETYKFQNYVEATQKLCGRFSGTVAHVSRANDGQDQSTHFKLAKWGSNIE